MDDAAANTAIHRKRFWSPAGWQVVRLCARDDGWRITWELERGGIRDERDFDDYEEALSVYDLADMTTRDAPWRVPA